MDCARHFASALRSMRPLLPTYIHLLISAIFPIYTAAHASLVRPSSAAPKQNTETDSSIDDSETEEAPQPIETLTPSDAILFPVLAGATLASLYFILKWLQDPALLNYYLGLYFAFVGLFFAVKFIKDALSVVRSFVFPTRYSYQGRPWTLSLTKDRFTPVDKTREGETLRLSPFPARLGVCFQRRNSAIWRTRNVLYTKLRLDLKIIRLVRLTTSIDTLDIVGLTLALPLLYYHTFVDKPWFLTNLLGFSFCYGSLQFTTPGTSATGTLLLTALFFYDIYFVFFTPMMVTVATKLDVPIKLLFPRPDGCVLPQGAVDGSVEMEEYLECIAKKRAMAMLGLGDIVIPGMMLAFALRFDLYLHYQRLSTAAKTSSAKVPYLSATGAWGERFWTNKKLHSASLLAKQFPKPYFHAGLVGYVLGMIATLIAMQLMHHAQPALLYLVPCVLTSLWGTALMKGDLKALWNYSEVPDEQEDTGEKKTEKKVETTDSQKGVSADCKEVEDGPSESKKDTDKALPSKATKDAKPDSLQNHLIYFSLSVIDPNPKLKPKSDSGTSDTTITDIPSQPTTTAS